MAEESSSSERNEEPTGRRLEKAREEGEAPRSVEVAASAVTLSAFAFMLYYGGTLVEKIRALFASGFIFNEKNIQDFSLLPYRFASEVGSAFIIIMPLLLVTALAAILGSGVTGGYLFRMESALPNFGKLDPMGGLKRMFGAHAVIELIKSVAKFSIAGLTLAWAIYHYLPSITQIALMNTELAVATSGHLIMKVALTVTFGLLLIAIIDMIYQKADFAKRMRMSKQEIRDEMKDTEGRPEVKAQIKRRQREMANSKMMDRVKDADVIITNPEHFSVALVYDPESDGAPMVIAKGANDIALRIRQIAEEEGIHIFAAAPLARALYFTTKINHSIPEDLYHAAAQVLAYVFSLNSFKPGMAKREKPKVTIPSSWLFDSDGQPLSAENAS